MQKICNNFQYVVYHILNNFCFLLVADLLCVNADDLITILITTVITTSSKCHFYLLLLILTTSLTLDVFKRATMSIRERSQTLARTATTSPRTCTLVSSAGLSRT